MKTENVIVAALSIAVISIPLAEAKDLPTSINKPRVIAQDSEILTEAKNHLNSGVERYSFRDFKGAIEEYTQPGFLTKRQKKGGQKLRKCI